MTAKSPASSLRVLVLPGDGIGPEVVEQALAALQITAEIGGVQLELEQALIGGAAIDDCGQPLGSSTLDLATAADAVILGAVGGPKWDEVQSSQRPERGLLQLRKTLGAYANLRPARAFDGLEAASPLRAEKVQGLDFVMVRELTGGIYFGEPRGVRGEGPQRTGFNTMTYSVEEIRRIGEVAFRLAQTRSGRLVSVDKANVLEVQALWRTVMTEMQASYPDVALSHMYVDNCAMQLVIDPLQFDVLVTGNLFGDILSDQAAAATGSIGMLPSASLGDAHAIFEPIHGSAPDIAGQGRANPLASILSVGMLFEHTAGRPDLASRVTDAVERVLGQGLRTADLMPASNTADVRLVSTTRMGEAVVEEIRGAKTAVTT